MDKNYKFEKMLKDFFNNPETTPTTPKQRKKRRHVQNRPYPEFENSVGIDYTPIDKTK